MCVSGDANPNTVNVEEWDGSSWTEIANVNAARTGAKGFGSTTSAVYVGGNPGIATNEEWNGTAWTEVTNINTGRGGCGANGIQTDGMIVGGNLSPHLLVEQYDGSAWTEVADLPVVRAYDQVSAGNATTTAAVSFGGGGGAPYPVNTAEWDAAVTASSFTSS